MKGITGILARGGRSETTTGTEVELDFDSILSGTGIEITMPNSTAGSKFLTLKSGASDTERFAFNYDGSFTMGGALTVSSGGLTVTAGGLTVTAGGLTITAGGLTVVAGSTDLNGGATISSGASVSGAFVSTNSSSIASPAERSSDVYNAQVMGQGRVKTYMEYLEDFLNADTGSGSSWHFTVSHETGTTTGWRIISSGTSSALGIATLSGNSTSVGNAVSVQHKNRFINMVHGKKYYFETRVKCHKLYKGEYFIGLCNKDTAIAGATSKAIPNCTDFIGFANFAKTLKWHFVMGTHAHALMKSATSTPNIATGVTGTYIRLGFKVDCTGTTTATCYVNGVAAAAPTQKTNKTGTSVPYTTALTPTSGVSTYTAGGGPKLLIDYINVVAER